jgi:hypothetical protein
MKVAAVAGTILHRGGATIVGFGAWRLPGIGY